jgi:hypothetical protein
VCPVDLTVYRGSSLLLSYLYLYITKFALQKRGFVTSWE